MHLFFKTPIVVIREVKRAHPPLVMSMEAQEGACEYQLWNKKWPPAFAIEIHVLRTDEFLVNNYSYTFRTPTQ